MSLFERTAVIFYVISRVPYVSSYIIFTVPTEVAGVTEVMKVNYIYDVTMPAFQRVSMDSFDGRQKNTRVKRFSVQERGKLSPTRLVQLVILFFRSMFSSALIEGYPALNPAKMAEPIKYIFNDAINVVMGNDKVVSVPPPDRTTEPPPDTTTEPP